MLGRVCDPCHSRKVRCDRNDPCGNCLDQNATCTRSRGMRRLPKRDRSRMQAGRGRREVSDVHGDVSLDLVSRRAQGPQVGDSGFDGLLGEMDEGVLDGWMGGDQGVMMLGHFNLNMNVNVNVNVNMGFELLSIVPLTDDQMINRRVEHRQGLDLDLDLAWTRRQALESALAVAGRILGGMGMEQGGDAGDAAAGQRHVPPVELLYWMLDNIGGDKFGSFISDYFRHIGKAELKHMGLSLVSNTASPPESRLYTVCVNSIAFKFLNATLTRDNSDGDELAQRLGQNALMYRETAKAALRNIPLLTKSSLTLLQALLCGIFLHQGSGDTHACRALAKTACRVCMDIGLHPGTTDLQSVSEAEYYCFVWCYKLDRNYAWKFGGPRILDVQPGVVIDPTAMNVAASQLFLIHLDLAKVQDAMIPFLNDPGKAARDEAFQAGTGVGTLLLRKMEGVRRDIDQIRQPSPNWTGLDARSEIATLDFAYHCILTNLLHLRQIALGQTPLDNYLDSARRGLQALISLCDTSSDVRKTAAYLHWTLLYYPITTCIALLCNTLATSHSGDFAILSAVSHALAQMGPLSAPIAAMQRVLQEFVERGRWFFLDVSEAGIGSELGPALPVDYGSEAAMATATATATATTTTGDIPVLPTSMDEQGQQVGGFW
ncbi:hypothetical protein BDW62DRAFT_175068 [Aspergillus aurantiobrunneus]